MNVLGQANGPTFNGQAVHDAFLDCLHTEGRAPVFHLHQPYPDGKDLCASSFDPKSVVPDHKFYLRAASDDTRKHKSYSAHTTVATRLHNSQLQYLCILDRASL